MASRFVRSSVPAPLPLASRPTKESQEPLLTARQASEFLQVPVSTLAVWRSTGRVHLPFVKVGGHVRYRRDDIERFLAGESFAPQAAVSRIRVVPKPAPGSTPRSNPEAQYPTLGEMRERIDAWYAKHHSLICDGCGADPVEPIEACIVTAEEVPAIDPAKRSGAGYYCLCAECNSRLLRPSYPD